MKKCMTGTGLGNCGYAHGFLLINDDASDVVWRVTTEGK